MFRFLESKTTKEGTTLPHEKKFTGLLGFLMGDGTAKRLDGGTRQGGGLGLLMWIGRLGSKAGNGGLPSKAG